MPKSAIITIKDNAVVNGVHLVKGLSVQVSWAKNSPFMNNPDGRKLVAEAFLLQHGLDVSKAINSNHFIEEMQ